MTPTEKDMEEARELVEELCGCLDTGRSQFTAYPNKHGAAELIAAALARRTEECAAELDNRGMPLAAKTLRRALSEEQKP